MEGVSAKDLGGVLDFVEAAWAGTGEEPFPAQTLEALMHLIPCDSVTYCELDRLGCRQLESVSTDPAGDGDEDLFWRIAGEHPLCRHQQAYSDFSATRLSDVISTRRLASSRVYADWFRPLGVAAEMEIGIARTWMRSRNFILDRSSGDFSLRDRRVLDMVRPHLERIRELTELRRQRAGSHDEAAAALTPRESEILELVGAGLTNAAIAQRLWIAPGTVKKHLDNVYEKLGVSSRAAAAAYVTRRSATAA